MLPGEIPGGVILCSMKQRRTFLSNMTCRDCGSPIVSITDDDLCCNCREPMLVGKRMSDTDRLSWLIKQGPPGAADGIGLNEEAWEISYGNTPANDQDSIRATIDSAMTKLQLTEHTWQVHVYGPDDILECPDELSALRQANALNRVILEGRKGRENDPNWPYAVALVEVVERQGDQ